MGIGIEQIVPIALAVVLSAMVIGFGAQITSNVKDTISSGNESAPNAQELAVGNGTAGLGQLAGQLPNVGLIAGAVIIIGLLVAGFGAFTRGR